MILAILPLLLPLGSAQDDELTPKQLFLRDCARCHGENGDGKGTTELDRPARSFRDGGFSFGNTPEAISRTIANGIPGSPMPSFAGTLDEAQRLELAEYVISLGPKGVEVVLEDTVLIVKDRPAVVRGLLPPIAPGTAAQPRGLLIGTPDGLTFEYRTDDVRLLGIRQGEFVQRGDWVGRGGDALAPLGKVVHLFEGGDPGPTFELTPDPYSDGTPLIARLSGSWIDGQRAGVSYRLLPVQLDSESAPVTAPGTTKAIAQVRESGSAMAVSVATGHTRRFEIQSLGEAHDLGLRVGVLAGSESVDSFETPLDAAKGNGDASIHWSIRRRGDGLFECTGVGVPPQGRLILQRGGVVRVITSANPGMQHRVDVIALLAPEWNDEVKTSFVREVSR